MYGLLQFILQGLSLKVNEKLSVVWSTAAPVLTSMARFLSCNTTEDLYKLPIRFQVQFEVIFFIEALGLRIQGICKIGYSNVNSTHLVRSKIKGLFQLAMLKECQHQGPQG